MMMDTVVIVAIGVLGFIVIASILGLLLVCKHKCSRDADLISSQHKDTRPDLNLIDDGPNHTHPADVELADVHISNPRLEELLEDDSWVDDATGLVPHCISIMKICHDLTERLVGMTMANAHHIRTQELLTDIVSVAKRINPRVDEVVESLYPPLDCRLLEARCTALVLSVSHLVLVTKHACHFNGGLDWIDQSMANVEDHLRILREASYCTEWVHTAQARQEEEQPSGDIVENGEPNTDNQSSAV